MELSAQIIKEMSIIVDDNNAMTKLLKYVRKLVKTTTRNVESKDITDIIANGLREVKDFQDGKIRLNTLDSLINELEN